MEKNVAAANVVSFWTTLIKKLLYPLENFKNWFWLVSLVGRKKAVPSSPIFNPQAFYTIFPLIFDRFSKNYVRFVHRIRLSFKRRLTRLAISFRLKVRALQVKILGIKIGLKLAPPILDNFESKIFVIYLS